MGFLSTLSLQRNHADQLSLRVEHDRNEAVPVRKKGVVSVQTDHAVSNILLKEMYTREMLTPHLFFFVTLPSRIVPSSS